MNIFVKCWNYKMKSINFQKLAILIMEFSNKELIYPGVLPVF